MIEDRSGRYAFPAGSEKPSIHHTLIAIRALLVKENGKKYEHQLHKNKRPDSKHKYESKHDNW